MTEHETNLKSNNIKLDSGIAIKVLYDHASWCSNRYIMDLGFPGCNPYTRGIHPTMYRGKLWSMRQYAGYGNASESNVRFKYLLSQGVTGLSVAFDLPTQMGLDPDDPLSAGEIGKTGVSIATIEDMNLLFNGIALDKISTSMTINSTASILLAMYIAIAEKNGINANILSGTVQNDILKEFIARGTYIYPPEPSLRLVTDLIEYCVRYLPKWNPISISGYHIREAGSTSVQEVAFTIANAIAYVESMLSRGIDVDSFAPRISFFFNAQINLFEEVAKFRAARRVWTKIMSERFNAKDARSMQMRFHTQTAGSSLTAQQPYNNIVRTAIEGIAAVLGGTQSLHTNSFDEAISLPSEKAAKIALRTQQIIGYESGIPNTVDPVGGSYYIEWLTDEIEKEVFKYIDTIDKVGGAVKAIESGYIQREIADSAYRYQLKIEDGTKSIVGVNVLQEYESIADNDVFTVNNNSSDDQIKRFSMFKEGRKDPAKYIEQLKNSIEKNLNLMPSIIDCVRNGVTLGEISSILKEFFGTYKAVSLE